MNKDQQQTSVHMKQRWILGLLVIPFVLQLLIPSRVWIGILVTLGGALGLAYLWARQIAEKVTVLREQYYGWARVGDVLEERFTLDNGSFFPVPWVEIDDHSDLPGYVANTVRSADGKQEISWRTEALCRQRGLFTLGPWSVRTGDPLGLFAVQRHHPETRSILVYPPVMHLPSIRLPRGAATGAGRTSRRALEVTANAAGVREYAPGDSLSRVHWRSTAHQNRMMVKVFDLEPSGDLWIVLDMDGAVQTGEGEESTEEYGVILAASLADRTLQQNRAVGLAAYGMSASPESPGPKPLPTIVLPQKGKAQQWRILRALATVRAGGIWPLGKVLEEMDRNLGRGMTLAVITPSCDPEWVAGLLPPMRRGVAPTVILLDPGTFQEAKNGDTGLNKAAAMVGLLAEQGIPSHLVTKGVPFKPVVEYEGAGRPELKVLPGTGRVIAVER